MNELKIQNDKNMKKIIEKMKSIKEIPAKLTNITVDVEKIKAETISIKPSVQIEKLKKIANKNNQYKQILVEFDDLTKSIKQLVIKYKKIEGKKIKLIEKETKDRLSSKSTKSRNNSLS